jgi:hypothetical protein
MVAALSLKERNSDVINQAIAQLQNGRNNATGTVTLAVSPATTTTVPAPNCSPTSIVFLQELTADAAAARFSGLGAPPWVLPVAGKGQFVITHPASAQVDRTFGWVCLGGN